MTAALAILSILIIALSLYGVLLPHRLIGLARGLMQGRSGLWIAVTIRLLLAVFLWFTAPVSHTPAFFRILAVLMLLAVAALFIAGRSRLNQFIAHIASWPTWVIRLQCLLGVVLGGFLLWSISSYPDAF
jgi:hypothetical protein